MDPRVTEFQCIMPMANMSSVLRHGILSFEHAKKIEHESVALEEAQEKRDARQVPGGLMLHHYLLKPCSKHSSETSSAAKRRRW